MGIALSVVLSAAVLLTGLCAQGQPAPSSQTNSFDLEVTVGHPGSREFGVRITIRTEESFKLIATTGERQAEISGLLHFRQQGKFMLDFTLVEAGIGYTNTSSSGMILELDKPVRFSRIGGIVHTKIFVKLQRHESRFASLAPTYLPNYPTAANPVTTSRFHADGDSHRVADWNRSAKSRAVTIDSWIWQG